MAKLLGPDFFNLEVRNLAVSRAFYTELLGLTIDPRFDRPDTVAFETNSIPFALSASENKLQEAPQRGAGISFWLDCDNVDELHAKLAAADVTIIESPHESPFGRNFSFVDPDGYRITANQNPWNLFPLGGKQG